MKIIKTLCHSGYLRGILGLILLLLGGVQTASAFTSLDQAACWSSWTNAFYYTDSDGRGYFRPQEGNDSVSYMWMFSTEIEAANEAAAIGLASTNWVDVEGATATHQMTFFINSTNGSVFYRMVYP